MFKYKLLALVNTPAKKFFAPLFIAFALLSTQSAQASHLMGMDITFTCLGGDSILIRLAIYRDCAGITVGTTAPITISSATCGYNGNLTLNETQFYEASPLCPGYPSTCQGGVLPGVEVHIYEGIFVLPFDCPDWTFSYNDCCRNNAITTLTGPGGLGFYVEATYNSLALDTLGGCNNSASFASSPIPYICAGQVFTYNHGTIDIDGDSLVYSLAPAFDAPGNPVPYEPGITYDNPFFQDPNNVFEFCPTTGQMTFTPNQPQVAVVAIQVDEYRNGVLISTIRRDMQVVVVACTNNTVQVTPPVLQTPNVIYLADSCSVGGYFIACPGTTFVFTQDAFDADVNDTINVIANNSPGIQVVAFPYMAPNPFGVAVQVTVTQTSTLTLEFYDNSCPIRNSQIVGYTIYVPRISILQGTDTLALCGGYDQNLTLHADVQTLTGGDILWTQIGGTPVTITNPDTEDPSIFIPAAVLTPLQFQVSFTDQYCTVYDTITVAFGNQPMTVEAMTPDSSLCGNGSLQTLNLHGDISQMDPYFYGGNFSWSYVGNNVVNYNDPLTQNPTATLAGPGMAIIEVNYTLGNCSGTDTVHIYFENPRMIVTPALDTSCLGTPVCYTGLLDTVIYYDQGLPYPVQGTDVLLGDDQVTGALPIGFTFNHYCNPYTDFYISSNGFITFDNGGGSGCCSGQTLPNGTAPNNLVALCWEDLNPANAANTIKYYTTGTAPNRKLVVNYISVPYFGGVGAPVSGQIVLHETTGYIDLFSFDIQFNAANIMTQGIESLNGTYANVVPGRNATAFAAVNDGKRFKPAGCTNYNLNNLPEQIAADLRYDWPGLGILDTNQVCITPQVNGPVICVATLNGCAFTDTAFVVVGGDLAAPTLNNCVSGVGEATVIWNAVPGALSYDVSINGGPFVNVGAVTSYTVTGLTNGECANFTVRGVAQAVVCGAFAETFQCCALPCIGLTANTQDPLCAGGTDGQITVIGVGGQPPYTFELVQNGQTVVSPDSVTFINLGAGTYSIRAEDSDGCFDTIRVSLINPPAIAANATATAENCNANGTATVVANGGTGAFTYLWNDAGAQTTDVATGLAAQTYVVTVTDANGCTSSTAVTVPLAAPTLTLNTPPSLCNGDSAQLTALFVSPNGNAVTYTWAADPTLSDVNIANPIATPLVTTTYTVTATDGVCTLTSAVTVNVGINYIAPAQLPCTNVTTNTLTFNWDVVPGGGGFEVSLDGGNTWIPANGPNGLAQDLTGLQINTNYTIMVRVVQAGNPCTNAIATFDCTTAACATVAGATMTPSQCFGDALGTITVNANGAGPIEYILIQNGVAIQTDTTGQTITYNGLTAGDYQIRYMDVASQCFDTIDITITSPTQLDLNASATAINCFGDANGTATAVANGGTPNYNFIWSPGGQNTPVATGLAAGTYNVTVFDQNGCTAITTATVAGPGQALDLNASMTGVSCFGGNNGTATAVATGVQGTATYTWSAGVPNGAGDAVTGLAAGNVTVTIIDSQGCQDVATVNVTEPQAVVVTNPNLLNPCAGATNGSLTVAATGGNGTYTYDWGGGITGPVRNNLAQGTYNVVVTDGNGCTGSLSMTLQDVTTMTASIVAEVAPCVGVANGSLTASAGGANAPYTYQWPNQAGAVATNLAAGTYTVIATDVNGCTASASATLIDSNRVDLQFIGLDEPCENELNGAVTADPTGGTGPYSYVWTGNVLTATLDNVGTGTYDVVVTDAEGCTASGTAALSFVQHPPLNITLGGATQDTFVLTVDADYDIQANPTFDTAGTQYAWNSLTPPVVILDQGAFQTTLSSSTPGVYTLEVSAIYDGCSSIDTAIIIFADPVIRMPNAFSPNGDNVNDLFFPVFNQVANNITIEEFKVFNRWGNVVHDNKDLGWDGTFKDSAMPRDVYIYAVKYRKGDQQTILLETGEVTLMR